MIGSYRALVVADGGRFGQYIFNQLRISPLCHEIFYKGPPLQLATPTRKMRDVSEIGESQVEVAFFDRRGPEDGANFFKTWSKARVDHLSILAVPGFFPGFDTAQFKRISVFSPSFILTPESAGLLERFGNCVYPIAAQFLPSKYREISGEDLALAMRLNAELCAPPAPGPDGRVFEVLRFPECMQVIGRDDRI